MAAKRHYLDSSYMNVLFGLLIVPIIYSFVFLTLETSLHITIFILTLLAMPFLIQTYVIVRNGKVYKYTLGGKNKDPSLSLNIDDIESIEKIKKNKKVIGLSITISYHHDSTILKSKTAPELLKEILIVNNDIPVS